MWKQHLAAAMAVLVFVSPALAGLGRPTVQNIDGVPTISGGVGEEERRRLEAIDDHYNLKMVFSLDRGALVSDVGVTVTNADGHVLMDTMAGGPWFYAQLPRGRYEIVVQKDGTALERNVQVGWGRQTTVLFDDWKARDLRASSR